jgi:hypothetical protein
MFLLGLGINLKASNEETLGFLCLVTCERDRPTLPTKEDIEALKKTQRLQNL